MWVCFYFFRDSCSIAGFAISAMGVRGGIQLSAWILMGFLSEKTGLAKITPPLYAAMAFPVTGHLQTLLLFSIGVKHRLFFYRQHFLKKHNTPHKSWGSTICLLSRSLVKALAVKAIAFLCSFAVG